jgi:hypothetical protein
LKSSATIQKMSWWLLRNDQETCFHFTTLYSSEIKSGKQQMVREILLYVDLNKVQPIHQMGEPSLFDTKEVSRSWNKIYTTNNFYFHARTISN